MTNKRKHKIVFISWIKEGSRSFSLSYHLGANNYFIHSLNSKKMFYTPLRYLINAYRTLNILNNERPDVIFVQNPPVFAVLFVWLYCIFCKCRFIVDTHSAAFNYRRWVLFLWLYRFLSKRALINILHNEPLAQKVAKWGAPTFTLGEIQFVLKTDRTYPFLQGFNVVFVSCYAQDEPTEEVIEAARKMPSVNFYITGKISHAPISIINGATDNVIFTDFLPNEDYVALLKGSDIVISLTKNDNTMQNGAYEGLILGCPIITSNWPVLRNTFYKGAICIDNSSGELVKAIKEIKNNYPHYIDKIRDLQEELKASWGKKFLNLLELLDNSSNKKS